MVRGSPLSGADRVLDDARRAIVVAATAARVAEAARRYGIALAPPRVLFDLKGAGVGMYVGDPSGARIRYNPWLFAQYFEDNLRDTVAHEVAHYVVDVRHRRRRVRPHGPEWRRIMLDFGVEPAVRHDFDTRCVPLRRQRRFAWYCRCGEHALTTVRHRRMLQRRAVYTCRRCGQPLSRRGD